MAPRCRLSISTQRRPPQTPSTTSSPTRTVLRPHQQEPSSLRPQRTTTKPATPLQTTTPRRLRPPAHPQPPHRPKASPSANHAERGTLRLTRKSLKLHRRRLFLRDILVLRNFLRPWLRLNIGLLRWNIRLLYLRFGCHD